MLVHTTRVVDQMHFLHFHARTYAVEIRSIATDKRLLGYCCTLESGLIIVINTQRDGVVVLSDRKR